MGDRLGIAVGITGFVVMLVSATIGLGAWRGRQADRGAGGPGTTAPVDVDPTLTGLSVIQGGRRDRGPKRPKAARQRKDKTSGTFMQRMEQRWQRRRDQRGI